MLNLSLRGALLSRAQAVAIESPGLDQVTPSSAVGRLPRLWDANTQTYIGRCTCILVLCDPWVQYLSNDTEAKCGTTAMIGTSKATCTASLGTEGAYVPLHCSLLEPNSILK